MPRKITIYHRSGATAELYTIDAREAVVGHPGEWSFQPFPAEKKQELAPEAKAGDEAAAGDKPRFVAVHRGKGSYSVMDGDKEVVEKLTKEEAEKKAAELNAVG